LSGHRLTISSKIFQKISNLLVAPALPWLTAEHALINGRARLEGRRQMKTYQKNLQKFSFWQVVFLQSKVNGAAYRGEQLPRHIWNWPRNTYFQHRLRREKWYQVPDKRELN
jgi:hypothetical protein